MKKEVRNTLFFSLILMVALMLPSFFNSVDYLTQYCIYLIVDLLIAFYMFNSLNRIGAFRAEVQRPNWKNLAILSPVLIILLSNFIGPIFYPGTIFFTDEGSTYLFLEILQAVLVVLIDEMLFRMYFQKSLRVDSHLRRIIYSACIFAAFDILYFFETLNILLTLYKMAYSFVLGVILGTIMEFGHSVYPCIILNLLFKLVGETGSILVLSFSDLTILLGYILPLVAVVYIAIIYFIYFRKKEFYYVR